MEEGGEEDSVCSFEAAGGTVDSLGILVTYELIGTGSDCFYKVRLTVIRRANDH